jgi:hypothetical protein
MNRNRLLLGIALAVLTLSLSAASFTGGFGFFTAPSYEANLTLDEPPTATVVEPEPSKATKAKPCNGQPGNPIVYYANDPSAARYNNFGKPLDPRLSPLDHPRNPKPDVRQIVDASWDRLCHDPALTRAVVAAAFPNWDKLDEPFNWMQALEKLTTIGWDSAELVYYTEPPTTWTMMMKHGKDADTPPTTYITRAHHAGWYLRLAVDRSHKLLLRPGCGDQPSLDLTEGTAQAALTRVFPVS